MGVARWRGVGVTRALRGRVRLHRRFGLWRGVRLGWLGDGRLGDRAHGLHPVQRPQRLLHLPHHRGRLRSAAQDGGQVGVGEIGEAEAVAGMRLGIDDLDGEHGLGRVSGVERGDGGHGDHVAGVECVLGVFGRFGEGLAEGGEDFSGEAWGEGLEGIHLGAVRVFGGEVVVGICEPVRNPV